MNKKIISFALSGLVLGSFAQLNGTYGWSGQIHLGDYTAGAIVDFSKKVVTPAPKIEPQKETCFITCLAQKLGKPGVAAISAILGLAIYRLYQKKAEQEPVVRFEFEKLKSAVKTLSFKEAGNQIWYLIDDIIIGQLYKKDGVKANKEGTLEVTKGTPSTGLLGNLQGKIFPISMAVFFALEVKEFMEKAAKSGAAFGLCTAPAE